MNREIMEQTLEAAISEFGADAQMDMLMEECAELIQAVNKYNRAKSLEQIQQRYNNLSEEIADVEIMIAKAKMILKNEQFVEDMKRHKIDKLNYKIFNK